MERIACSGDVTVPRAWQTDEQFAGKRTNLPQNNKRFICVNPWRIFRANKLTKWSTRAYLRGRGAMRLGEKFWDIINRESTNYSYSTAQA